MNLSKEIKKMREERGWTQEKLADIADINVKTIQRIESGENASTSTLNCLANAFNVEVKDLKNKTTEKEGRAENDSNDMKFLKRLTSGQAIVKVFSGVHAFAYDHDELNEEENELVSNFYQMINDYIDIWDCFEVGDKIKAEQTFQEILQELNEKNLWLFGLKEKQTLKDAAGEFVWDVATFQIVKSTNPKIISSKNIEKIFDDKNKS